MNTLSATENITSRIRNIRGERVILNIDLAQLYGVSTKRLNEQIKRNKDRFPNDFMFILTQQEKDELVANCDQFKNLKYSSVLPHAFTEHGVVMAANILKSPQAIAVSIHIVRAFVQLRRMLAVHTDLAKRLDDLEKRYDHQFKIVFDAIRELMTPPPPKQKRKIGFQLS